MKRVIYCTGTELLALFSLCAYHQKKGAKTVVPVNGSQILDDLAKANGGQIQRTRINYYSLMEAATQKDVAFVGESDGGFIFPSFAPFMDAMMSTAKLMEFIALEGKAHFPLPGPDPQEIPGQPEGALFLGNEGNHHAPLDRGHGQRENGNSLTA